MIKKIFGACLIIALLFLAMAYGILLEFIFFYPLFMACMWMIGSIYFYFHWERKDPGPDTVPTLSEYPFVSILVPCYNESENVVETIHSAARQNYPNFEIIAIDDGSRDDTGIMLNQLAAQYSMLRVVHLARNQGKAMAMRMGALVARSEYLVCVDGDAVLSPNATAYLVRPLIENPRIGAVTGNPRIRTRSTLLGRVQVGEFSSTIGLIKRAQRVYGNIFTVSGVIVAFRRTALHRSGYWSLNMVTEDIDVSWMLQMDHWGIHYEPSATCWILMPETYKGLWRQRLRWAQGGAEVFLKQIGKIGVWRNHRMWLLILDYCLSVTWSYAFALTLVLWAIGLILPLPECLIIPGILPKFWGLLLASVNLTQSAIALTIESRYERHLYKTMLWMIWYPFAFWIVTMLTAVVGFPRALFKRPGKRAHWVSPHRGFRWKTS